MAAFGRALRRIRNRGGRDLGRDGVPRSTVLAVVVRLLDTTLIRVSNRAYAKENGSYGLTTLRSRHVDVSGQRIRFEFRGKSGSAHQVEIAEARLARIVRRLLELPGQELFRYTGDEDAVHGIDSADVNTYLREIDGEDYSAKGIRTWYATLAAMQALERCTSRRAANKEVTRVLREAAKTLGKTPAICRKSYVHPVVIESYLTGCLPPGQGSEAPAIRLQRRLKTWQRRTTPAGTVKPVRGARGRPPATGARPTLNRA